MRFNVSVGLAQPQPNNTPHLMNVFSMVLGLLLVFLEGATCFLGVKCPVCGMRMQVQQFIKLLDQHVPLVCTQSNPRVSYTRLAVIKIWIYCYRRVFHQ